MATRSRLDKCYMTTAYAHAELSKATRLKVGATLVTKTGVTISGVNGLPTKLGNECETTELDTYGGFLTHEVKTKQETIHAELNAILKCAKDVVSCVDSSLYGTPAGCVPCSRLQIAAGIKEVAYAK